MQRRSFLLLSSIAPFLMILPGCTANDITLMDAIISAVEALLPIISLYTNAISPTVTQQIVAYANAVVTVGQNFVNNPITTASTVQAAQQLEQLLQQQQGLLDLPPKLLAAVEGVTNAVANFINSVKTTTPVATANAMSNTPMQLSWLQRRHLSSAKTRLAALSVKLALFKH